MTGFLFGLIIGGFIGSTFMAALVLVKRDQDDIREVQKHED